MQIAIPCVIMRGGTSRGPLFRKEWLPGSPARDRVLLAAMGSPHALQVDGIGGSHSLTSKAAIISRSARPDCDIDYLFAQVSVDADRVDYMPNCGNMLSAAAPFAIEQGLVEARHGATTVRVFNVNTGVSIDVVVQTPGGKVTYEGDTRIDGVPGTAAPVKLTFLGPGSGALLPTGRAVDVIDGVEVSCVNGAMSVAMIRAKDIGLRGDESPAAIDGNAPLLARIESLRCEAGRRMGMGDVSKQVVPKPVLLSEGHGGLSITSRYLTPWRCHQAHAVTGAISVATAFVTAGTLANRLSPALGPGSHRIAVHHPSGRLEVELQCAADAVGLTVERASLLRTARKIMAGEIYVPAAD